MKALKKKRDKYKETKNTEKFNEIKSIVESVADDVEKFYVKGNKAAAVRIRKAMQDIKNLSQELRVHVQETKNNL